MTLVSRGEDALVVVGSTTASTIPRRALVSRLSDAPTTVVVLSGPAGAGKSTVVQLVGGPRRASASPSEAGTPHLNDPATLADLVLSAFEAIGPRGPLARASVTGQEPTWSSAVLPGLAELAGARSTPYALVLDDDAPAAFSLMRVGLATE